MAMLITSTRPTSTRLALITVRHFAIDLPGLGSPTSRISDERRYSETWAPRFLPFSISRIGELRLRKWDGSNGTWRLKTSSDQKVLVSEKRDLHPLCLYSRQLFRGPSRALGSRGWWGKWASYEGQWMRGHGTSWLECSTSRIFRRSSNVVSHLWLNEVASNWRRANVELNLLARTSAISATQHLAVGVANQNGRLKSLERLVGKQKYNFRWP